MTRKPPDAKEDPPASENESRQLRYRCGNRRRPSMEPDWSFARARRSPRPHRGQERAL